MPLYTDTEWSGRHLKRFRDAVGGDAGDLKILSDCLDALMVKAVRIDMISAYII